MDNTCSHKCGHCVASEGIPLAKQDIDRLLMMGYYDVVFCIDIDHGKYLRRFSNGECVFLKNGTCQVWDRRPAGCHVQDVQVEAPRAPAENTVSETPFQLTDDALTQLTTMADAAPDTKSKTWF